MVGLKIPMASKEQGQLTLEVAIENGKFAQEARAIKRKALQEQDVIQVIFEGFGVKMIWGF